MAHGQRSAIECERVSGPVSSGQPEVSGQPRTRELTGNSSAQRWHVACSLACVLAPIVLPNTARQTGGRLAHGGRGGSTFARAMRGAGIAIGASLLALAGCRPSLDLCADGCATAGDTSHVDDGELGGAGGRPSGAAGDGGAPAVCETNDDCADALVCNGDELCEDGVCVAGKALTCDGGMTCSESDPGEPCAYATPSPWLLLLSSETIWGLPTTELGKRPMLGLGSRPSSGLLVGMNEVAFAPGGRHALVEFLAEDFGKTVLELSFGRGIPDAARAVANLPNWGSYSTPVFSPDGSRALLADYDIGTYLLDLSGTRAQVTPIDAPIDWVDDMAFCSDSRTWLRIGDQTALYAETSGQPKAIDLEHNEEYDVRLSPDARMIWLGGESQRLVACAPDARSEALGVLADKAEFSPDSRFLLLSLADGSAKLLSITESLTTTEVWSGSGVLDWSWSEGAGSLLLHVEAEGITSYGYLVLSHEQPELVALALDGAASISSCGRDACLARGPTQDDTPGPLLLQPLEANAGPISLGNDSSTAEVLLADFEHDRLLLQLTNEDGNELLLTDFAGAPAHRVFDWKSGEITLRSPGDDSGIQIGIKDNVEISNFWLVFPRETNGEATLFQLDPTAYNAGFQPWP